MADIKSLDGYNFKDAQARTDLGTHAADTSKHVTETEKAAWNAKQGPITDLDEIREGAALGATALQEHQSLSAYRTAAAQDTIDNGIQGQIDAIVSKSDVVDIVNTYAELQAYDTTKLHSNDVVKVLSDSTHADGRSYYRWVVTSTSGTWSYIGTESVGYTKAETDTLLNGKYAKPSSGIPASDLADDVIPTKLSELSGDSTHRTVTDAEKTAWDGKLPTASVSHETWTFTLEDDTTVDKEVVLWTSAT